MSLFKKKPTLLLIWTGFKLHAAIWNNGINESSTTIAAIRLEQALSMLPELYRKTQNVILAANDIVTTWVDFPVNPYSPKPRREMDSMARWELEPLLEQHQAIWSLGAVLEGRGSLSANSRLVIEEKIAELGAQSTPSQFGDLAIRLGLLQREELDQALKHQTILRETSKTVSVGHHGYHLNGGASLYGWLLSGTISSRLEEWRLAFQQEGLKLTQLLPLNGLATTGLGGSRIGLEIYQESVVAVLMIAGQIQGIRQEERAIHRNQDDWVSNMVYDWALPEITHVDVIWFCVPEPAMIASLGDRFGLTPTEHPDGIDMQMRQLAKLMSSKPLPGQCAPLPIKPPLDIDWKNPALMRWYLFGLGLALILGWAGTSVFELTQQQRDFAEAVKTLSTQTDSHSKYSDTETAMSMLYQQVKTSQAEHDLIKARVGRIINLDDRVQQLPELIRVLGNVIGDQVVLNVLKENTKKGNGNIGIYVEAWSLSDVAGQEFAANVAEAIKSNGFIVTQSQVTVAPGRNELPGYKISFWLIPEEKRTQPKVIP
ncbi:hypothetical protein [Chitinibacter sp. S2-10]|uniref:hypothetical protein n=1 Tax=Chitinibacter sp. S2-10 TaxID=3373597 RepID=UPI00397733C3